jgi:prophage regulatory protein
MDRLLTAAELVDKIGITRQHLSRLERRGEFPPRIQLGAGRVAWSEREVAEWLAERPRGPLQFRGRKPAGEAA